MPPISPRLPLALAFACALAMIATITWQGYAFWQTETARESTSRSVSEINDSGPVPQPPGIDLASVSLFGEKTQDTEPSEPDIDNLPETNLRLFLRGVLAASGDFPGSALIEDSKRQTEAYLVGDELPGNAVLRKVRPDRVVIERSGALENLFFPDDEDRSGMNFAANDPSNGNSGDGEPEYAEQQARPASFSGPDTNTTSESRREEIRQRLEQLRNRLRNNN